MARVGMMPTSIGLIPLNNPDTPSLANTICATFKGERTETVLDCNWVLTTSRGVVMVLETMPAAPPAKKLINCIFLPSRPEFFAEDETAAFLTELQTTKLANVHAKSRKSTNGLILTYKQSTRTFWEVTGLGRRITAFELKSPDA